METVAPTRVLETEVRVVNQTTRIVETRRVTALRGGMYTLPANEIPDGASEDEISRLELERSFVEMGLDERREFQEYLPTIQQTLQNRLEMNRLQSEHARRQTRPDIVGQQLSVQRPLTAVEEKGYELSLANDPYGQLKLDETYKEKVRQVAESRLTQNIHVRLQPFIVNRVSSEASVTQKRAWDKMITLAKLKDMMAECSMEFQAVKAGTGQNQGSDVILFYADYSDMFASAQVMGDLVLALFVEAKRLPADWTRTMDAEIRSSIEGLPLTNAFMEDKKYSDKYIVYIINFYSYSIITHRFAEDSRRMHLNLS